MDHSEVFVNSFTVWNVVGLYMPEYWLIKEVVEKVLK